MLSGCFLDDLPGEDEFEAIDRKIDLELTVTKLPENERKIIELYLDGYSQSEIATKLGLKSQSTISDQFNRAIDHLKRLMEP